MYKKVYFLFLALLPLVSCTSSYSEDETKQFDIQIQHYLDSTGLKMNRLVDGLYYKIINKGNGNRTIQFNDQVTFAYTGSFLNGKVFQKKSLHNPLTFKVNQLIIGWQEGLMMIKEGGSIEIIIPPQLGYGNKKTDIIPENTILKYKLTVLKVH